MGDLDTFKDPRPDLALAPLNLTIMLADFDKAPATSLESPTDGSLLIPVDYESMGHFEKKAGATVGIEMDGKDIEAYGELDPIRRIISKRTVTLQASFFENKARVLGVVWTEDFKNVDPSDFGGVLLKAPKIPKNIFYRCALVGLDTRGADDVYVYWLLPKVQLDSVENIELNDDNVVEYKVKLKAFVDPALGYSVAQGFAGPGWRALVDQAGFAETLTAISSTPSSASVTAATGASHTAQLVIHGDNGINYTPDCAFVSADPSKATVSASGLVTGVATGSTNITVSKGSLTATVAVTVT